jgi:hypothetical protein
VVIVEVEEETVAIAVAAGDKVDVVGEDEEVGARPKRELETGNLLCFHETIINNITIPGLATTVPSLSGRQGHNWLSRWRSLLTRLIVPI